MALRAPRPQRDLHAPATRPRTRSAVSVDHQARLARRLTPRDRWLIRMLHEHRVLTTDQITAMAFPSPRAARRRLLELYDWNVVDRFQPLIGAGSAPMHYVCGAAGAAVLAAEEGVTTTALGYRRDDVLAIAHRRTLAHTVAVNDIFADLVHHNAVHHDAVHHNLADDSLSKSSLSNRAAGAGFRLVAWWSETRCLRLVGDLARPDAYGRITAPTRTRPPAPGASAADPNRVGVFEWFFELDFGTEPLARLAAKLDGYAALAAATHPTPVLIWLPSPRREAHAREHLAEALRRLERPELVPVATTSPAATLSVDDDQAAAAYPGRDELGWLPVEPHRHHPTLASRRRDRDPGSRGGSTSRCGLAGLAARWPATGPPHSSVVAPDRARARVVELPAPDPFPPNLASPDTARASPDSAASGDPATACPAARRVADADLARPEMFERARSRGGPT